MSTLSLVFSTLCQGSQKSASLAKQLILAGIVTLIASATLTAKISTAAEYPVRPIRLIVPQPPGAGSDTISRIVAAELTRQMGQQIIVENRAGGALTIGTEMTVRATPDGYTIGYVAIGTLAISPHMVSKLPYDVLRDLQAVVQLSSNQMLLAASPTVPFKTVREVIDYAKKNPDKLSNASSGNGTPGHLTFELFKFMAGTQIVHVPYQGGAAGITDLIAGRVQLMMESLNSITPHVKAGRLRGIAVSGTTRSIAVPELPTIAESGVPGYEAITWNGIAVPVGVPKALVARLNAEINRAITSSTIKEQFAAIGADPTPGTPEQFSALIRKEYEKWGEVVKRSGAKID